MRKRIIGKILENPELSTKVYFYFSTKTAGEDYDTYEQRFTYTDLNPIVVKMYVRELEAESLVWRQMGTKEAGAKEIICDAQFKNYFLNAHRMVIEGDDYEVYKEATGGRMMIQKRPYNMLRVIVRKI